jgi:hypothetical protein
LAEELVEPVDGDDPPDPDPLDPDPLEGSDPDELLDEAVLVDASFLVDELDPLSLLSASRADPNDPAERLSVL